MALDLYEQEQVAALKAWWKSWGKYIAIVIVALILLYLGYQGWQAYQDKQGEQASTLFFAVDKNKEDPANLLLASAQLIEKYPQSGYATRAALMAAKVYRDQQDFAGAQTQLEWVVSHSSEAMMRDVARVRLARLFLDLKKYDQALDQLKTLEDESYSPQYQETKGDILAESGKTKEAIEAYKQALAKVKDDPTYQMILQVKLYELENKK